MLTEGVENKAYSRYILQFYDFLFEYENIQHTTSGITFIWLIFKNSVAIFFLSCWHMTQDIVGQYYRLSLMQTLYFGLWFCFMLNFYILYTSNSPVYMRSINVALALKWTGFNFSVFLLSFCYAMSLPGNVFAQLAFYFTWVLCFVIQHFQNYNKANFELFIFCSTASFGTYIIYCVMS